MLDTTFIPFGAQYYRAPTPRLDQWARDMKAMADHGFNTIKIWAQWRWNNPREGEYDFSDLAELMDLADQNGLKVVINAIYDVAPAWFWRHYPDSVMVRNDGLPLYPRANACRQIGGSPGPSYHHAEGIAIRRAFTEALARTFADHPALYLWDLWNEPELNGFAAREPKVEQIVDYSEHAVAAFRTWLQTRYETVDALNARWGRNYQSWDEVEAPRLPDTFTDMIDWRMFFVDTMVDELRMRSEAIRAHDSSTPVMVHTVPMPYFNVITCASDEYRLAAVCDVFGNSVGSHPFAAALTTVAAPGKPVINAEIHAIHGSTFNCPPVVSFEDMKRHILIPLARGVKGFLFWQYRPETLGTESPAWGLTDLEGNETEPLRFAKRINTGLQRHAADLHGAHPLPAEVAIVNGTRNQIFDWCAGRSIDRHYHSVYGAFMALYRNQFNADVVSTEFLLEQDLTPYKVIYYPFPYYMEDAVAERLKQFVRDGGTLISEAFFGGVCESTGLHSYRLPGLGFDEVFGVREGLRTSGSTVFDAYLESGGVAEGNVDRTPMRMEADLSMIHKGERVWGYRFAEELQPTHAEVLARFEDGRVAITHATYGKGKAIMVGTLAAYWAGVEASQADDRLVCSLVALGDVRPEISVDLPGTRVDLLSDGHDAAFLVATSDREDAVEFQIELGRHGAGYTILENMITGEQTPVDASEGGACCTLRLAPHGSEMYRLRR